MREPAGRRRRAWDACAIRADSGAIDAVYKDEDKTSPRLSQAFALVMDGQAQLSEFSPLQYLINTLNSADAIRGGLPLLVEAARFPEIRSLLYKPLETGTRDEKIYLARVLAASGDAESVPYLQKVSQDPDSSGRRRRPEGPAPVARAIE